MSDAQLSQLRSQIQSLTDINIRLRAFKKTVIEPIKVPQPTSLYLPVSQTERQTLDPHQVQSDPLPLEDPPASSGAP